MPVVIARESPDQPAVAALLGLADARSASLYPAASRHGADVATLLQVAVRFFVARRDGAAVGCGGYATTGRSTAELKRLFVAPETRGGGIGQQIVLACEAAAAAEQVGLMQLETGVKSDEALRLYRRLGYRLRGPFGRYAADPLSVFMEKTLIPSR